MPFSVCVFIKNYRSTVKLQVSHGKLNCSYNCHNELTEPIPIFCKLDTIANLIGGF